jgi:phytoene dehydrogenase-like protein
VTSLDALLPARATLLDVTPRQLVRIAGPRLPRRYARRLERFRYGFGAFKIDYALSGPIPWRARECARAGTVHLGGTLEEIAVSEAAVARGELPDRPYAIVAQQSLFDATRAPAGCHTAWVYCHVPNGSTADRTDAIERQLERFAPGFRDLVIRRATRGPAELERDDPNLVGGDVGGGANDLVQMLFRPAPRLLPWSTPLRGVYLCSASTPPGGGVHGMCGFHAAQAALRAIGVR